MLGNRLSVIVEITLGTNGFYVERVMETTENATDNNKDSVNLKSYYSGRQKRPREVWSVWKCSFEDTILCDDWLISTSECESEICGVLQLDI